VPAETRDISHEVQQSENRKNSFAPPVQEGKSQQGAREKQKSWQLENEMEKMAKVEGGGGGEGGELGLGGEGREGLKGGVKYKGGGGGDWEDEGGWG